MVKYPHSKSKAMTKHITLKDKHKVKYPHSKSKAKTKHITLKASTWSSIHTASPRP